MDDAKAALRSQLKEILKAIAADERPAAAERASHAVFALPEYRAARRVMLFVSLRSELDTRAIALEAWSAGKHVTVPRAHMEDRSMEAVVIRSFEQDMAKTKIGVLEPIGTECLAPRELDFVLVPGLGFGEHGERIGRGAGFYDRFLASLPPTTVTCGYAFEQQVIDPCKFLTKNLLFVNRKDAKTQSPVWVYK